MNKIKKWLDENGIQYTFTDKGTNKYITILLESGCVWVNGFGENMYYDRKISIHQDTYKNFEVTEQIGYNRFNRIAKSTKQDNIVKALTERLSNQ